MKEVKQKKSKAQKYAVYDRICGHYLISSAEYIGYFPE